ncbi:hypothetical protein SHIRM173S_13382 [Streptomyces hirsutus]
MPPVISGKASGVRPPSENPTKSTRPRSCRARPIASIASESMPPGPMSALSRTPSTNPGRVAARIPSRISARNRRRLPKLPPYRSSRRLSQRSKDG